MNIRWKIQPEPNPDVLKTLIDEVQVSPLIAKLLAHRGISTFDEARDFFRPSLAQLHDPFLMKDMDKAVERILEAIASEENILVFGDYDVDGTTAVSLVYSYLSKCHPNIATYIPDRYKEGYGISYQGIDFAYDNGVSLIIALDCGIKSIDHVNYAKEKNIDFIICDHHRPGHEIPDAVAVLDPKREDCEYPYKELCGCGVGFKLIQALHSAQNKDFDELISYLDLVAIAIAADIVPVTGENRILAKFGLEVINTNPRIGVKVLAKLVKKPYLTISDVVFGIAPKINAAGRIYHGQHSVNLLTESDFDTAQYFAKEIELYNAERKSLDKQITEEALDQIIQNDEIQRFSTVVYHESWHKGVIGIVASRLTETYFRPTLVFTKSEDKLAASARSVPNFDVYNALEACSEHIEQFGGHMYAAGLTIKEENYENFKDAFEKIVSETITEEQLSPEITIDQEIELDQIDAKTIRILKLFEPFGPGNMTPVFSSDNLHDTGFAKNIGTTKDHLKLCVQQGESEKYDAVGFGLGKKLEDVKNKKRFQMAYCIDENHYNGKVSIQLRIKDLKPV